MLNSKLCFRAVSIFISPPNMQILQWLYKPANEQATETSSNLKEAASEQEVKTKDLLVLRRRRSKGEEKRNFRYKKLNSFAIFLCGRDIAKVCFQDTLNLKRPRNFSSVHDHNNLKMKMVTKEDIARGLGIGSHNSKADVVSNKVLPIIEGENEGSAGEEEKEKLKSEKHNKKLSRMKELLRWAAATKLEKGGKFLGRKVLHFRNRSILKAVPDSDQMSNESPKISFRWDAASCSTTTSAYSYIPSTSSTPLRGLRHCSSRRGNWITTDNEFVVLEL